MDLARLRGVRHPRTAGTATGDCAQGRWIFERDRVANLYWWFYARAIPHIGILCTPL